MLFELDLRLEDRLLDVETLLFAVERGVLGFRVFLVFLLIRRSHCLNRRSGIQRGDFDSGLWRFLRRLHRFRYSFHGVVAFDEGLGGDVCWMGGTLRRLRHVRLLVEGEFCFETRLGAYRMLRFNSITPPIWEAIKTRAAAFSIEPALNMQLEVMPDRIRYYANNHDIEGFFDADLIYVIDERRIYLVRGDDPRSLSLLDTYKVLMAQFLQDFVPTETHQDQ